MACNIWLGSPVPPFQTIFAQYHAVSCIRWTLADPPSGSAQHLARIWGGLDIADPPLDLPPIQSLKLPPQICEGVGPPSPRCMADLLE